MKAIKCEMCDSSDVIKQGGGTLFARIAERSMNQKLQKN